MRGPESINSLPKPMRLWMRVRVAWAVLRGEYNTGARREGAYQLYRFKPYVLYVKFESGDSVLMQCKGPGEPYEAMARREITKRAPWADNLGEALVVRVIQRSSWTES